MTFIKRQSGFDVAFASGAVGLFGGFRGIVAAVGSAAVTLLGLNTKLFIGMHGQSLASGSMGVPTLNSGTSTFENKMVAGGVSYDQISILSATATEQPQVSLCEWLSFRETGRQSMSHNFAVGGQPYSGLMSGTSPYNNGIRGLRAIVTASVGASTSSITGALCWIHGDADESNMASSSQYADYITTLQSDFQRDFRLITTQSVATVPLFYSQLGAWSQASAFGRTMAEVAQAQYQAHISSSNVILVSPHYHLSHAQGGNDVHLTAYGYRRLGEYYAKAIQAVLISGSTWMPLRPGTITANDRTVTIDLEGGDGSTVVIDTGSVNFRPFYGFQVVDPGGSAPHVQAVTLTGNRQVTMTLTDTVTTGSMVAHALDADYNAECGPHGESGAPGGNVRDSDPTPSRQSTDDPLRNWLVGFRAVPSSITVGPTRTVSFDRGSLSFATSGSNGLTCRRVPGLAGGRKLLFSTWAKRSTIVPNNNETLFSQNATNKQVITLQSNGSGNLRLTLRANVTGSAQTFISAGGGFTANVWHNVVGYYSGSGTTNEQIVRMWLDGVPLSGTFSGNVSSSLGPTTNLTASFEIGSNVGTNFWGQGNIQHVALWIEPDLSSGSAAAAMTEIYNGGVPGNLHNHSLGTPTRWWPLTGSFVDSGSAVPRFHAFPIVSGAIGQGVSNGSGTFASVAP